MRVPRLARACLSLRTHPNCTIAARRPHATVNRSVAATLIHLVCAAQAQALFEVIDANGDGELTFREVKVGLLKINNSGKRHGVSGKLVKSAQAVFDSADVDKDKRVNARELYEFMRATTVRCFSRGEERMGWNGEDGRRQKTAERREARKDPPSPSLFSP